MTEPLGGYCTGVRQPHIKHCISMGLFMSPQWPAYQMEQLLLRLRMVLEGYKDQKKATRPLQGADKPRLSPARKASLNRSFVALGS